MNHTNCKALPLVKFFNQTPQFSVFLPCVKKTAFFLIVSLIP